MGIQANAIVAREAARRYGDKNILSFAVDPGTSFTPSISDIGLIQF